MKKSLLALLLVLVLVVTCAPVSLADDELEPVTLNVWVGGHQ